MPEPIELENFVTVGEMAKILGISRQGVHARIERGKFEKVYFIRGENGRKTYLFDRRDPIDTDWYSGLSSDHEDNA